MYTLTVVDERGQNPHTITVDSGPCNCGTPGSQCPATHVAFDARQDAYIRKLRRTVRLD